MTASRCAALADLKLRMVGTLTRTALFHDPGYPATEAMDAEQRTLADEFNDRIAAGKVAFEIVPCLCGAECFSLIARYDRYRVRQDSVICTECGLIQSMPRLTESAYRDFYGSDFYRRLYDPRALQLDGAGFETMVKARHYRFDFVRTAPEWPKIGKVLELGCGGGWNLMPFARAGRKVVGYDPSPGLVLLGRSFGLDLRQGWIESIDEGDFDLIVLSHAVEHFTDPVGTVKRLVPLLAPGGSFYIEVPNADHFILNGLQTAHTYYFSPSTLCRYMGEAGLETKRIAEFASHMGGMFRLLEGKADLGSSGEYDRMCRLILSYQRRESIKAALNHLGLLPAARRLWQTLRGSRGAMPNSVQTVE